MKLKVASKQKLSIMAVHVENQNQIGGLAYSKRLKTLTLDAGEPEDKRIAIKEYFNQTFSLYEDLFAVLATDEAYYTRADPLRHPLIFYYGHTACFFINKFVAEKLLAERVNSSIESICAVGVDELSWDDLNEKNFNWPTVKEVTEYRHKVRSIVNRVIDDVPLKIPITWNDLAWLILMGIEHERIHLETSSALIRQLPVECVQSNLNWGICQESGIPRINQLLPVEGGKIQLGKQDKTYYGWDNEYGILEDEISPFSASQYVVTNGEFQEFVTSKGYGNPEWWTNEGWQWVQYENVKMPRFWRVNGQKLRCMLEVIDMPLDWPVEVNYFEAKAFCNWMSHKTKQSVRLPTEAEWLHLRNTECQEIQYPNWEIAPGNIDLAYWASSCPVTKFQHGRFYDLIGNVWEWSETAFHGFPGYKPHPAYDDFSTPTFDGKHNLIKSGSWISTGNEALTTSRYAFRRHFYQHAGFRYVVSKNTVNLDTVYYETDTLVSQYLEFHYGPPYLNSRNYPSQIVKYVLEALGDCQHKRRAMDLGSAVGRASFELARHFAEVIGVDFSTRFIQSAVDLQQNGKVSWQIMDEGELTSSRQVRLEELQLTKEMVNRVKFVQGDACNLKENLKDFDVVVAANLIDRLYDPIKFLESIQSRIVPGGILAVSSPYTWMQEHTDISKWLGGYKNKDGEGVMTLSGLKEGLSPHFEMIGEPRDVEFVIRETRRKYQHTFAQLTLWRKKELE